MLLCAVIIAVAPQERSSTTLPRRAKFLRYMATRLRQVQPALAFAARHLDEDLSLDTLADRAGLSAFHLHRVFAGRRWRNAQAVHSAAQAGARGCPAAFGQGYRARHRVGVRVPEPRSFLPGVSPTLRDESERLSGAGFYCGRGRRAIRTARCAGRQYRPMCRAVSHERKSEERNDLFDHNEGNQSAARIAGAAPGEAV